LPETGAGTSLNRGRSADPYFTALTVLLLPDRHDLLESVDYVAASLEGLGPVGAGNGDDHCVLADFQTTEPMLQSYGMYRPPRPGLVADLMKTGQSHRFVRFVLEALNFFSLGHFPNAPDKRDDPAAALTAY
jgi:hypothetical protein